MPPPDTTAYTLQQLDSLLAEDGMGLKTITDAGNRDADSNAIKKDGLRFSDWLVAIFLLYVVLIFIRSEGISLLPGFLKRKIINAKIRKVMGEKGEAYHKVLSDYNPYYNSLSDEEKYRFLKRVIHFADSKDFRFHAMDSHEHIPVLISGAAVQLTFGLKNYLLDYFDIIHVMKKEYVLSLDNETYYGHVSKTGIHISWSHFEKGYSNYTDSINLGLHEMAHALQFDAVLGFENRFDTDFKERLNNYTEQAKPVFKSMRAGMGIFFDDYAMTNFDEFWAVSIENFFENPALFKKQLPELYNCLCQLLNQDPQLQHKIIDPDLV